MYQQQMPQPRDEHSWSSSEGEYDAGYLGSFQPSAEPVDPVSHRPPMQAPPALQMVPGMQFHQPYSQGKVSAGQRLALALVSVCVLIPLAGIALGILKAEGLIALAVVGAVILGINFVFSRDR